MVLGPGAVAGWTALIAGIIAILTLIFVNLTGGSPTQKIPRTRIVDITKGRCRVIVPRRDRKTKDWRHATHRKGEVKVIEAGRGKPIEHLFEAKNLDRLPKDELLVVVCYSGTRAIAAVTSLKMLGFTNTRVMKGGIVGLAKANSVKNAPAGQLTARTAIGYENELFYIGATASITVRNFTYQEYELDLATEEFRFTIGRRFNMQDKK